MIKEQWKAASNASFWLVVEPWEDETIEQATSNSPSVAYVWGSTEELAEARARLIAAAPDLLQSLKEVVDWLEIGDHESVMHTKARQAIAKATGEQK